MKNGRSITDIQFNVSIALIGMYQLHLNAIPIPICWSFCKEDNNFVIVENY